MSIVDGDSHGGPRGAVLHALRLGGVLEVPGLARRSGLSPERAVEILGELEAASLVVHRSTAADSAFGGWSLTAAGRGEGEALLAEELDARGARAVVGDAYALFLDLNAELLVVCTDWQVRTGTSPQELNDHSDAAYDSAVLRRLSGLHRRAADVLGPLEGVLMRFGGYRPRLTRALQRASSGEVDWVTRPVVDSYHTVWFELHEDLLATLGAERSEESARRARSIPRERPGTRRR